MEIRQPRKNEHRCAQIQCGHYINGGCKACIICKADPFIINNSCTRCTNCESVPGELRWDEKKLANADSQLSEAEKLALQILADGMARRMEQGKLDATKGEIIIEINKN